MREEWNNRSEGGMGQSEWRRNGTIGVREEWNNRSEGGMEQSESTFVVFNRRYLHAKNVVVSKR